jgi:alanine-glyoxylate transaminase/serine-glyoxylate transaminase/serine-pyruvate transaminase
VPEAVLAAMMRSAVDLSDPDYLAMIESCFVDIKQVFRTKGKIFMYACNGHGAWEAALVNVLSPGDLVLAPETGQFADRWAAMAGALGLKVEILPGDWRTGIDPNRLEARLAADKAHEIKAILAVQTDTATAITSDIGLVRQAMDAARHPALLLVDAIASLATIDFRMDEWGVDVAVACSQKGLMLPPGLGFTATSKRALEVNKTASMPRNYWDWRARQGEQYYRQFCGTSPEHLLYALRAGLDILYQEGLENVFARHQRLADAVRGAVAVWSQAGALEFNAVNPAERSNGVTTIVVGPAYNGDTVRLACRDQFDLSLGAGLGKLDGKAFRIGHMGWLNEPMVLGALASVEAALTACGVPYRHGGVDAAVASLTGAGAEQARPRIASAG